MRELQSIRRMSGGLATITTAFLIAALIHIGYPRTFEQGFGVFLGVSFVASCLYQLIRLSGLSLEAEEQISMPASTRVELQLQRRTRLVFVSSVAFRFLCGSIKIISENRTMFEWTLLPERKKVPAAEQRRGKRIRFVHLPALEHVTILVNLDWNTVPPGVSRNDFCLAMFSKANSGVPR